MFYECILLIRPDVSAKHVAEVTRTIESIIEKNDGQVIGSEYWGFKTLAYRIEKRAKAHYVCLGFSLSCLDPIYAHLKFHKDVLRHLFIKKPKGLQFPTVQMQSSMMDLENQDILPDHTPEGSETTEYTGAES